MKHTLWRTLVGALALLAAAAAFAQQRQGTEIDDGVMSSSPRVLPIEPAELLKLMPATPANWKLTSSQATNQVSSWLLTTAQRQLEFTAPAPSADTGKAQPAMHTRLVLIDTGYDAAAAGVFADFKPGVRGRTERLLVGTFPAIRTRASDSREALQLYINRRFIFRVEVENQQKDAVMAWVRLLPIDRFNVPSGPTITSLPPTVSIRTVNELDKTKNREGTIAIATPTPGP